MYKLKADYHTHTVMSRRNHGKSTAQENIEHAISLGLEGIGISDHGPRHLLYGVQDVPQYLDEMKHLKQVYEGVIDVYANIELNFIGLGGEIDLPDVPKGSFDKLILGFHQCVPTVDFETFMRFYGHRFIARGSRSMVAKATDMYIHAIERGDIDIIAHLGHAIRIHFQAVAEACKEYGTLVEINNTHRGLDVPDIIQMANVGCKFIASSDAHEAANVGNVATALSRIIRAGLTEKEVVNIEPWEE